MKRLLWFCLAAFAASACSAPATPPAPATPDAALPPPPVAKGEESAPKLPPKAPPGAFVWSDDEEQAAPAVVASRALGGLADFQGFSADEQEFVWAKYAPGPGFVILHVVTVATNEPVRDLRLESVAAEKEARAWLAAKGFSRLQEAGDVVLHGGKPVQAAAKGLEVTCSHGGQELWKGNPFGGPVPTSNSAKVRVVGLSPKGSFAVVRAEVDAGHEFGKAVGVQLVKLP